MSESLAKDPNNLGVRLGPTNNFAKVSQDPRLGAIQKQTAKNLYRNYVQTSKEGYAGWKPEQEIGRGQRRDIKFAPVTIFRQNTSGEKMNIKMVNAVKDLGSFVDRTKYSTFKGRPDRFFDGKKVKPSKKALALQTGLSKRAKDNFKKKTKTKLLDVS